MNEEEDKKNTQTNSQETEGVVEEVGNQIGELADEEKEIPSEEEIQEAVGATEVAPTIDAVDKTTTEEVGGVTEEKPSVEKTSAEGVAVERPRVEESVGVTAERTSVEKPTEKPVEKSTEGSGV